MGITLGVPQDVPESVPQAPHPPSTHLRCSSEGPLVCCVVLKVPFEFRNTLGTKKVWQLHARFLSEMALPPSTTHERTKKCANRGNKPNFTASFVLLCFHNIMMGC